VGTQAGWDCGSKEREARVWRAMGKSKERAAQDKGTRGKMAATTNAEWGELTTARRCEACDGQLSRKIFLRGGKMYRGGRLDRPVARAGLGSGP
jgi:hypothetical protein